MSRFVARSSCHDASLHEYYEACADDSSDGEVGCSESDRGVGNCLRPLSHSPLGDTMRLNLYQRDSVQHALQLHDSCTRRGPEASAVAAALAIPLGVPNNPKEGNAGAVRLPKSGSYGSNENNIDSSRSSGGSTATTTTTIEERIVFDALCALRQSPNMSFEASIGVSCGTGSCPPVWGLRAGDAAARSWENVTPTVRALAETIIAGANDCAKARWQLRKLAASLLRDDVGIMDDAFVDYSATCTGEEGLFLAARLVLSRFSAVVRAIMQHVSKWTLLLQEGGEEEGEKGVQKQKRRCARPKFTSIWWADMQRMVEATLVPLRRCIHLMENACSLSAGSECDNAHGQSVVADELDAVTRASSLVDYLIVRMSALQDGNTMDLYRFYMVLLVYCSWPYVLLMTSAIFGFVADIDADMWRSKVPRIFRLSFSHIRVGDGGARIDGRVDRDAVVLPTDILSLVLLCVGYRQAGAGGSGSGEDEEQWRAGRVRRRAAFSEMLSWRSFILRSFVSFARQKVLVGWSRKRSASQRVAAGERADSDAESWHTVLGEWESRRFMQREGPRGSVAIDSLPLALCADGERDVGLSLSGGIFWAVHVEDRRTHHDVLLVDTGSREFSSSSSSVELWLHASLPAARWVTASLLVPIGQVVHHLQERWLVELLSSSSGHHHMMRSAVDGSSVDGNDLCDDHELSNTDVGNVDKAPLLTTTATAFLSRGSGRMSLGGREMVSPHSISFRDAVKLLVDVALCRDSERIVHTFLYRLFLEPHWWYRCDGVGYVSSGTASSFVSTAFGDAIRGNELARFVRLSVAPKAVTTRDEGAGGGKGGSAAIDKGGGGGQKEVRDGEEEVPPQASGNAHVVEILHAFASFELLFLFPPDIELILLPQCLSVAWGNTGAMEEQYGEYFWRNRSHGAKERQRRNPHQLSASELREFVQDTWSYCFGYLCSLYYTRITLREQRKRLQRADVDTCHTMSAFGRGRLRGKHAVSVTRGLGSAYFELSFAVDSLINFMHSVVGIVAREMEEKLTRVGVEGSCITLCQRLDFLVLQLRCVCFPLSSQPDDAGPLAASVPIRDCIAAVLTIALDPASLSVKHVTSRTQNAIEALVAVVRALPVTSLLKERLRPLLVLLTFNRFYGE